MVEIRIDEIAMSEAEDHKQSPIQEINEAYKACTFGRFHIKLLCIAFLGTCAGMSPSSTAFLLPEAECDLNMDLVDKGLLSGAPFLGMLISSVIAGFLTDAFGRKVFLQIGFGGVFLSSIVAGSSQCFEVLLTAKFFEGVFFATAISAHTIFISEFCHKDIRDQVMIAQYSFLAICQIICPVLTWGILTQDWHYSMFNGYFVLRTWNFYIYIMGLWSFFACIFYSTLPESPKYLVTRQKYVEAREILLKIYKENTGKATETYPYKNIWKNLNNGITRQISKTAVTKINIGLHNAKQLFRKPLIYPLIIACIIMYFNLAIYNVIRIWFPQLSTIVEHYKTDSSQDLCMLLDTYTSDLRMRGNRDNSTICVPNKSGSVTYISSIIIGIVCLVPYFVTGAVVNRVGKKAVLTTCGMISVALTLSMRWASTKPAIVALFASDTAITQLMKGINQAVVVEMFPTQLRSLAMSIVLMSGRLGTLSGNISFPVLLNKGCVVPIFTMTGIMACVTILVLFTPKKKN